jgi:TPR repeat protein/serine/threonine protein kinase
MAEPEILGHYRIERRADGTLFALGRGAMGTTYKAFDTKLHYQVALKVINNNILGNEVVRQRFLREARAAAGLRHKNVASVFHLGDEGDTYFYAMEFIDGETVESMVNRLGKLAPSLAVDITLQVVSALAASHRQNVIHRDLKPANLMIVPEDDGEFLVKVIDFGLAKSLEAGTGSASLTQGGFVGTPYFASPEQLEERQIDGRSDIYSLGATLWYMLAGRPMFTGGLLQVMSQHLTRPPPREQLTDVPEPLVEVLERMLAKDPARRQQTPMALRQELMAVRRQLVPDAASVYSLPGGGTTIWTAGETSPATTPATGTEPSVPALPGTESNPFLTGAMIAGRYRLDLCCGRSTAQPFFQARDLYSNQDVALKVLPLATLASGEWETLQEAVKRVQAAPHPNLRVILSLERFESYGLLVSEWIAGPALIEAIPSQSGFPLPAVVRILGQLVPAVDHARQHGLDRLGLGVRNVFAQAPDEAGSRMLATRMRQPADQWPPFTLKAQPLLLASVIADETVGDARARVIMADLHSAAEAGNPNPRDPYLSALGFLAYELLAGRDSGTARGGPISLASLSPAQNDLLRSVVSPGNATRFESARAFYEAFRRTVPDAPGSAVPDSQISMAGHAAAQVTVSGAETIGPFGSEGDMPTRIGGLPSSKAGASAAGPVPSATVHSDVVADARLRRRRRIIAAIVCSLVLSLGGEAIQRFMHKPAERAETIQNPRPAAPAQTAAPSPAGELGEEKQLMKLLATGQDLENAGDPGRAIRTYTQAVKRFPNFDEPMLRLNKVLEDVQGQLADPGTFDRLLGPIAEAADSGSGLAMMLLGNHSLPTNPPVALRWYQLAAESGRRDAMTQLGKMYWSGQGLETGPDLALAASWLDKASQRGDPDAKYQLALLYEQGKGASRDLPKAVGLLREAAEMHDGDALNLLGEFYRDGTGVPVSFKEAIDYFEQARDLHNADASANLGVCYINGNQGVDRNLHYGMDLIRQSAEQGSPLGMYYYGVCFEKGVDQPGNAPNLEQAKIWYSKAAARKYQKAIEWCDKNNVPY